MSSDLRDEQVKQTKDKPGTIRFSSAGDIAFLTTDTDEAPWFHIAPDGRRYFATDEDVQDWEVYE
jgi:polyphosphate kinase 2 (PPK2 family)